jgi:hypothetical protein
VAPIIRKSHYWPVSRVPAPDLAVAKQQTLSKIGAACRRFPPGTETPLFSNAGKTIPSRDFALAESLEKHEKKRRIASP